MNVTTTRTTAINLINSSMTIMMVMMVIIVMMNSAHAGLARQQLAQPGVVPLDDGHQVPVWVSNWVSNPDGPYIKTMVVHLGVPHGHPDARGIEMRFMRAVTPLGCKSFTEELPELKYLIQVEVICDRGTNRSPDDRVKYISLSAAGSTTDVTALYRRLHRPWMPVI